MARVERQAVKADIWAEAVELNKPLRAVMTLLAQALKRANPEFIDVAMVRLDVVVRLSLA
jgi:hypothetical protein